jgi:DNA-binding MarR family transcriptional regulator
MMQLWEAGPQRPSDLVRLLGSDAPTMTRTVQRLERAGFVCRRPHPEDGRASLVEATCASRSALEHVRATVTKLERAATRGMTPQEQQQALDCLTRLVDNLAAAVDHVDRAGEHRPRPVDPHLDSG